MEVSLGIVLQDTHLFIATVMDNIPFKLDATDEEVIAAAKLANGDTFIRCQLPDVTTQSSPVTVRT